MMFLCACVLYRDVDDIFWAYKDVKSDTVESISGSSYTNSCFY